jgi:hypothetical protein
MVYCFTSIIDSMRRSNHRFVRSPSDWLLSLFFIAVLSGCTSKVEVDVIQGRKSAASAAGLKPISGMPGDLVTLTGTGFKSGQKNFVRFTKGDGEVISAPVSVLSDTSATFVMPEGLGLGVVTVVLESNGQQLTEPMSFVANLASNNLDIFIGDASEICSTKQYIDRDGLTQLGTKNCSSQSLPNCSSDGQVHCVATTSNPSVVAASIDPQTIRVGNVVAGVNGSKRDIKQCRNAANLSLIDAAGLTNIGIGNISITADATNVIVASDELNWSPTTHFLETNFPVQITTTGTMPGGLVSGFTYYVIVSGTRIKLSETLSGAAVDITSTGSGTLRLYPAPNGVVDLWDTIDDRNNDSATPATASPWSSSFVCSTDNFENVSSAGLSGLVPSGVTHSGATSAFSQIWLDKLTGLYFTNLLYDAGGGLNWAGGMGLCNSLDSGDGIGKWRMPTQKELLQLYINGVSRLTVAGGSWSTSIRSSTVVSTTTGSAHFVYLSDGTTGLYTRNTTGRGVLCVR